MAARRVEEERVWQGRSFEQAHRELVDWLRPGDVLVGHNLKRFDRLEIVARKPDSPLLELPYLDTLELSVVGFPGRPYHRLAKDDQLVRDARPNPLSDVRASERVLTEAVAGLRELPTQEARTLRRLLSRVQVDGRAREGWHALFGLLGWRHEPSAPLELRQAWADRACLSSPWMEPEDVRMDLVMVASWLRVAQRNDGSVLPGWVRRVMPSTLSILRSLRATPCQDEACAWCSVNHSPEHWLQEVFGFPSFRDEPRAPDGSSLQRLLVKRGLLGDSTFGILPTGGGKSLCFQIPAEARHRMLGQLTVVISPLQSLMKDQVDALQQRIPHAHAIYGGLPGLLRPQVMEQVRSGECGLLYLSPEQLRNVGILRMLSQRELGAVVFDEAHCLSQWGHDFRTDYPYVLKALGSLCEEQQVPSPPVFLFTATTQHDATLQILEHVAEQTGVQPEVLDGGSDRHNLRYEVREVPAPARLDLAVELIEQHVGADGAAIVFCGTQGATEDVASGLEERGLRAAAYHAGLKGDERRELQDAFLSNQLRVMVATNAFGMGVDKPNVRLVLHLQMPSSPEAYFQEAGRAGRDRKPATAVLLWAPGDAEPRFALGALSNLDSDDLRALWRAIDQLPATHLRHAGRLRRVVTPRELLFQEALQGRFDPLDKGEETRVKTGVNWLEQAHVLQRRENQTHVFSGRPRVATLEEAHRRVDALDLPPAKAEAWRTILELLFRSGEEGLSADDIAVVCRQMSYEDAQEGGLRVLSMLKQMVDQRLVTMGQTFAAFVAKGVQDSSARRLERWRERELSLLAWLFEERQEATTRVHLRSVADRLTTRDAACTVNDVARALTTWSSAGQGVTRSPVKPRFQHRRDDSAVLTVEQPEEELRSWLTVRHQVAHKVLDGLLDLAQGAGKQLSVSSELEVLVDRVERDLSLRAGLLSVSDAVRGAVSWMHELRVVTVSNGLAVFRAAMSLDRDETWPKLGSEQAAEAARALQRHQLRKILRVHVMDRWAQAMLEDPERADGMRRDWFKLSVAEFIGRWFPGDEEALQRPTTPESYHAIVTALGDAQQEKIVTRDLRRNHLVLAGPGSGKTRVLVHRIAWLLRCHRVRPRQVLVVCYTRANALELRRRLVELVGRDARWVSIRTLHGVALSMVGAHRLGEGGDLTLESCITEAAAMLRGERLDASEQSRQRDALLRGFHYLFVDEYQDIDAKSYALLSAIAGRAMGGDQRKLRVFAVGDDDQAIFAWDGASTDFIRSFEDDYRALRSVVTHNYRNPKAVLELAQDLIRPIPGRLKEGQALEVNPGRRDEPPMGPWATAHPKLQGRIPWVLAGSVSQAASALMSTVRAWIDDGVEPTAIGVLTRTRPHGLHRLRVAAEARGVPFSWPLPSEDHVPISRVREVVAVLDFLRLCADRVDAGTLYDQLAPMDEGPWTTALRAWLEPQMGQRRAREAWTYDLLGWVRLERRARTIGQGVHLGTMHSAKGMEFEHVLILDEGRMDASDEDRRLLYVALTRAKRSLQLFSGGEPSPNLRALRSPALERTRLPAHVGEGPSEHDYGLIDRDDIFIDWLGRRGPGHPGHQALEGARVGQAFNCRAVGGRLGLFDERDRQVGTLSAKGQQVWGPRLDHGLRIKLLAVVQERAEDVWRAPEFREPLRNERWWTGVWECRWRR
ncbi:MAG: RecQ family ATP-dependent DNA helicase [Alphaproteobacteria bacterium]|nr:RecQ family ATP-dependent DNA helicase [Alphaproteobacteria bacterium]